MLLLYKKLEPREGGTFEHHDHHHEGEDHDANGGEEHAHSEHADDAHEHEHEEAHKHEHEEAHEDGHEHEEIDPHVWLDPENAKAFVEKIVTVLSAADPANAASYAANGQEEDEKLSFAHSPQTLRRDIETLRREVKRLAKTVKELSN